MKCQDIIQRCEELYRDLDLQAVQDWKQQYNAKAIGFMPIYVPRELIDAAGMLPVGLMGGGEQVEIIRGDAYFQSYICHIPRSMVELAISERLSCLDGFIFPAICDVIRNLSGMWQLLMPGKFVHYFDVPQNFDTSVGGAFYGRELRFLREQFSKLSGQPVTDDVLSQSIQRYNENRDAIDLLYKKRAAMPHQIPTYELYLLMRASNVLHVTAHTQLLHDYLAALELEQRPQRDHIRVVVTGAFCEQPPLALIRVLEQSGCYIVDDDWVLGARFLRKPVSTTGDPIEALVQAYLRDTVATASRYEDEQEKGAYLIEQVHKTKAEGVIFCAPSFCDPALLERPMLQAALSREKIPFTAFKFSENTGQFQVIKEQAGTFADSIKLWGE